MDRAELKARARAQLGGGIFQNLWMMGLAVCLLIGLLESAAAGIIPGIGALLVVGPLEYGMAYIFLKQARDHQPVQLGDMFRGFQDDFGGTFLIGLMTSLFTFLWSLLFVIPGIVKAYAYSMAYYIKLDHPDYGWNACITASRQMMDGHKWEKFVLDLSFLGWIIVGSLCLGIVRQNIVFSLVVKFGCLALVAFGVANMWAAIFADVGVMVLAVLNAIRALKYKG